MAAGFGLDMDIALAGALDGRGDVGRVVGAEDGGRVDGDVEVVGLYPVGLVEELLGEGDAVAAACADVV